MTMRVDQFRYAIEFDTHPDIVLELGSALNALRKEHGARVQFLNVPTAAPPPAPRVVVNTENALIHIGQNRYEAVMRLPQHIQSSLSSTCDFARRVVDDDLYYLFMEDLGYRWLGLVASLQYPTAGPGTRAVDAIRPVFDRLVHIDRAGMDLASFQLQYGVSQAPFFKNYTIAGYERVNLPPKLNANVDIPLEINVTPDIITESGVGITVDFNNKPAVDMGSIEDDFADLLIEMSHASDALPTLLNLEGLI